MKKNMGLTDRLIRLMIAVIIGILYYTHVITGTLAIVALVVAGIFILTSFVSFCPIYGLFGLSSNKERK